MSIVPNIYQDTNATAGKVLMSNGVNVEPTFQYPQRIITHLTGTTDALPLVGLISVDGAAIDAMTLPTPTAGGNGVGDDGKTLLVISTGAYAHTITSASNKINGNKHIATFAAAVGSLIQFEALGGVWYVVANTGVTLT